MHLEYHINEKISLGRFLKAQGISHRMGRKIKTAGIITVNGKPAYYHTELNPRDYVVIDYCERVNVNLPISPIPLDIIYQDDALLVISKPAELSVQPSKKHSSDNLVGRINNYYLSNDIKCNIHIVNRLDYATSGLILVAKEAHTHHLLASGTIERKYLALVSGVPPQSAIIDLPIARDSNHSIKRRISSSGQPAITEFRLLSKIGENGIVEATLKTGRTHQIRLHMAAISHSVIGDCLYGRKNGHLMLHSYYIGFKHPYKDSYIDFTCYPEWYENICLIKPYVHKK